MSIDWNDESERQAKIDEIVKERLAKQKRSLTGEIEGEIGGTLQDLKARAARADAATSALEELQRKIDGKELDEIQQLQKAHERSSLTLTAERDKYREQFETARAARLSEQMTAQLRRAAREAGAGPDQIEDAAILLGGSGLFEATADDAGAISVQPVDPAVSLKDAVKRFMEPKKYLLDPGPTGSGSNGAPPPPEPPPKGKLEGVQVGGPQFAVALAEME